MNHEKARLYIELGGAALIIVLAFSCAYLYLWGKAMQMNCPAFGDDHKQAQSVYNWGNTHLDGDNDGKACE